MQNGKGEQEIQTGVKFDDGTRNCIFISLLGLDEWMLDKKPIPLYGKSNTDRGPFRFVHTFQ